jgi:hypothetical protein
MDVCVQACRGARPLAVSGAETPWRGRCRNGSEQTGKSKEWHVDLTVGLGAVGWWGRGEVKQWRQVAVPCSPQRGRATGSSPLTPVARAALASFATRAALVSRPPSFSPLLLWARVVNWLPLGGGGVVERRLGLQELLFYSQPQTWRGRTVDSRGWTRGG